MFTGILKLYFTTNCNKKHYKLQVLDDLHGKNRCFGGGALIVQKSTTSAKKNIYFAYF